MTNGGGDGKVPARAEELALSQLPPRVRSWLLYDAPWNYSTVEIYKLLRAGVTEDTILAALRGTQRKETRQVYGPAHPQASLT